MALYINTNAASLEAQRSLSANTTMQATTFQRLASGLRINSSADDASGLALSEQMNADVRSYGVAERNAMNATSMLQTADGALGQFSSMLQRMRELSVQSANGDLTALDRGYIDEEFGQLKEELARIGASTQFNGFQLLSGPVAVIEFQVGIDGNASDRLPVDFGGMTVADLGLSASNVAGVDATSARAAIGELDAAMEIVNGRRADFGARINRLQITAANLGSMRTNLSTAQGRITDVDVAEESAKMARQNVLSQAGVAILAQANQAPQAALQLLKG